MLNRALLTALALLVFLLTSCSGNGGEGGGDNLPPAGQLLTRASEAMRQVDTVRFDIQVEAGPQGANVGGFPIQGAQGQLTRQGDAKGTVRLERAGQLVELRFVLVGDTAYLQGPTGGFQQLPASFAAQVYDPSAILDPDSGVAALLAQATNATTEAREEINGVETYRIRATFPGAVLENLVPGLATDTQGTVWIGAEHNRLVQARFPLPDGGSATVRLSDFGAPAQISPPQ